MLSEEKLTELFRYSFSLIDSRMTPNQQAFCRAIESAATAPLLARIAELEKDVAHKDAYSEQLGRELANATRELEEARRKAQEDNYEFNRAINFAIDQGSEACHFLSAWREGDPSGWPEFNASIKAKEQT